MAGTWRTPGSEEEREREHTILLAFDKFEVSLSGIVVFNIAVL